MKMDPKLQATFPPAGMQNRSASCSASDPTPVWLFQSRFSSRHEPGSFRRGRCQLTNMNGRGGQPRPGEGAPIAKGVASVLCILLLHGVVGTAAAQYGGGGGGGSGGMPHQASPSSPYALTKLIGDVAGEAAQVDPHLVNAWGLVAGPSTPWWVANNVTSSSTLYTGTGAVLPLVVTVPGAPTGIVFNGGSGFVVTDGTNSGPATFLFATESGVISGWNQAVPPPASTQALTGIDRSGEGAIYKGLAIASTAAGDQLYATDFHNTRVDVFDSSFNLVSTPGGFVDKRIPRRYAPFGIQNINGAIFVTYARQDQAKVNDVAGATHGIVDMFDTSGNLMARVATKGALNAPWGLALAPSDFGPFSGELLVGNFGNGMIHAYHQQANARWKFRGPLRVSRNKVLKISGLWGLSFGNGGPAGPMNTLYFTAGPGGGSHGLFGSIQPAGGATTTPTTTPGASTTTTTAVGTQTHTVMVGDGGALVFTPANLTIQAGDTLRWVWGSPGHSVVSGTNGNADNRFCSPSNTGCDNPPLSSKGATYEHTFTQAGTFPYYCSVHFSLGMTGTITVQ
jgi:uncharacterized protein (TIGR03118 family)